MYIQCFVNRFDSRVDEILKPWATSLEEGKLRNNLKCIFVNKVDLNMHGLYIFKLIPQ